MLKRARKVGIFQYNAGIAVITEMAGGAKGDRTPDLGIANAALSQLSYRPFHEGRSETSGLQMRRQRCPLVKIKPTP